VLLVGKRRIVGPFDDVSRPSIRPIRIMLQPDRERLLLSLVGEVDLAAREAIDDALDAALADGWTHLVLDLRRTSFMDSAGVHSMGRIARRARAEGVRIERVDGPPAVERVLTLTGQRDVLPRVDAFDLPGGGWAREASPSAAAFVEHVLAARARRRPARVGGRRIRRVPGLPEGA
jgi:anti-anti-sigma factor